MAGKLKNIALFAVSVMTGFASSLLVSPATAQTYYVPAPRYVPAPSPTYVVPVQRDLHGPVSRMEQDVDQMYTVVSSYGGDNFARLRDDVYNLRDSTSRLHDAVDRSNANDISRAYSSVRRSMDETSDRIGRVRPTRAILDSWQRVSDSFHDVQVNM